MSAGITRIHGSVPAPSQRPSTLTFFKISFAATLASEVGVVNGAIDQIVRACSTFATVGMVGTVQNLGTGAGRDLLVALEDTGVDSNSPSGLGKGSVSDATTYASTAAALQALIQGLGATVGPNSKDLTAATVAAWTF
jgi:hypothetical protein